MGSERRWRTAKAEIQGGVIYCLGRHLAAPAVQACKGFRRVGDCVAAAHASQNLGVSFNSFREHMTGKQGRQLVVAIGYLRPDVDSSLEAAKAVQQTRDDVTKT
jgi:hypothetical protein